MAPLLASLGSLTAAPVNLASVSRDLGLAYSTLQRYLALLQTTMLVEVIPAWSCSPAHQSARAPKLIRADSRLAARLARASVAGPAPDSVMVGRLVETFIIAEILKLAGCSNTEPRVCHWRSHRRQEVDIVLDYGDRIVGIEVKSSATVRADDFAGLRAPRELVGSRPFRGIVAYLSEQADPFGPDLWTILIASLWNDGRSAEQQRAAAAIRHAAPTVQSSTIAAVTADRPVWPP